jgi:hypothetical protein
MHGLTSVKKGASRPPSSCSRSPGAPTEHGDAEARQARSHRVVNSVTAQRHTFAQP